jgi:hypothetical protein
LQQQPDARFNEIVACGERAVALALECLDRIDVEELRRYSETVSNAHIEACYSVFPQAIPLILPIARRQLAENQHLPGMMQARVAANQ